MKLSELFLLFWVLVSAHTLLSGQNEPNWIKPNNQRVSTSVGLQLWSLYTTGGQVFDQSTQSWAPTSDRLNFMIRRTRLGFKGMPFSRLKYNLTLAIDHVGNDDYDGATGSGNNASFPSVSLWNAFVQWQVIAQKETLYFTFGYFAPQFHRESFTSALSVSSMEKAMSQNYARRHLTGTGPGRAAGITMGGLIHVAHMPLALSYDLGVFAPTFGSSTAGQQAAPVFTGRAVIHLGQPEFEKYKLGAGFNTFGKRKGISVGIAASYQGTTDRFEQSTGIGLDLLANYGPINIKGDYTLMQRNDRDEQGAFAVQSATWNAALSWNVPFGKYLLEPTLMVYGFNGPTDALAQTRAKQVGSFSGKEQAWDFGINWYLHPKRLKLQLHYTLRQGDAGEAGNTAKVNQYFNQSGQAIQRGDWLAFGIVARF